VKHLWIFAILVGFLLTGTALGHAASYYDLNMIDLQVMDLQVLSMDDTPGYYLDNSDLVKITINVTNNGLDYFVVRDKLFKILVMEPNLVYNNQKNDGFEIVDNYSTTYDDELDVRYDNLISRELFNECDYTNDRVRNGESKIFTVCYDILRIWNNEVLNLDGTKKYYLVMTDNSRTLSCPNCKKILLSTTLDPSQKYHTPSWVQNIFEWHQQGIISDQEYQNAIAYLVERGIITDDTSKKEIQLLSTLAEKNMQLKEHQARLSLAQQTNLYVSSINFYESKYSDEFSGVLCKKQNNIVTLSGDYTNNSIYYDVLFFKLLLFDDLGDVVAIGLSKMVDVASKEFRHFSVSTPYEGKIDHCLVMVDSKF